MADTPETRQAARDRGYRDQHLDGRIYPSVKAQERYPLEKYPCRWCADQELPHLVDNGSEFYWHHYHPHLGRSGCSRFGSSQFCGDNPRRGTATSLFLKKMQNGSIFYEARSEEEYLKAQRDVEEHGADDNRVKW